jgi:hypothetical protein
VCRCLLQAKRLAHEDAAAAATPSRPQDFERHAAAARERWDVESVLSLRSNLDNHPASIAEPQSSRRPRQQVWALWLPVGIQQLQVVAHAPGVLVQSPLPSMNRWR